MPENSGRVEAWRVGPEEPLADQLVDLGLGRCGAEVAERRRGRRAAVPHCVGRVAEDHVVGDLLDVGGRREAARLVEHRGERLQGAELGRRHAADRGILQDGQHPVVGQRVVGGQLLGDRGGDPEFPEQRDNIRRAGRSRGLLRGRKGRRPLGAVIGLDADRLAAGARAGDILKLGELGGGQSVPRAVRELDPIEDEIAAVGAAVVDRIFGDRTVRAVRDRRDEGRAGDRLTFRKCLGAKGQFDRHRSTVSSVGGVDNTRDRPIRSISWRRKRTPAGRTRDRIARGAPYGAFIEKKLAPLLKII